MVKFSPLLSASFTIWSSSKRSAQWHQNVASPRKKPLERAKLNMSRQFLESSVDCRKIEKSLGSFLRLSSCSAWMNLDFSQRKVTINLLLREFFDGAHSTVVEYTDFARPKKHSGTTCQYYRLFVALSPTGLPVSLAPHENFIKRYWNRRQLCTTAWIYPA